MSRISLSPPRTLTYRFSAWASKRMFGDEMDPGRAMGHNLRVLLSTGAHEAAIERWNACDPRLKHFAVMAASHTLGCRWCTDFGYWVAHTNGIDEATLREVPTWRDSDRFTALERQAMAYAEAMCATPDQVTDEMVTELEAAIGTKALVELTMLVAVENQRSRFNSAMGLTSQGFAARCAIPA